MGIESTMGSYQAHTASTNTGAANRKKMKNAGYGGVRFRDTKGEGKGGNEARSPNWSAAGISDTKSTPVSSRLYGSGQGSMGGYETAAEVKKTKGGIAPTANSMSDLSIQYRADEATALKSGKLTDRNKRDQKIIDARDVGGGRGPQGGTPLDAFKKKYWEAREVWSADKGAYSGIVPSGSETSHSQRTAPQQSSRRLSSVKAPNAGIRPNSKYGLF